MVTTRVLAVLLAALIALAGCKRRPKDGPEEDKGNPIDVRKVFGVDPGRPPAADGPSAARVIEAFDKMADEINQDKFPSFWSLPGDDRFPRAGGKGVAPVDAAARAADLEAAFGRFWAAWESRPERTRQKLVRQQAERLAQQGTPPDKAREQAEQAFRPVPPLRVTTPNPDLGGKPFNRIEADVANGVRGEWSQNGGLTVIGSVEFSESLRLHCNGDLTARLRGRVGTLDLHANGSVVADLADVQAPAVEVSPNGNLLLRVGPGTGVLRLAGGLQAATVVVRGNRRLKLEGTGGRRVERVLVVHY